MSKSSVHLSANLFGLILISTVILVAKSAAAEPTTVVSPSPLKVAEPNNITPARTSAPVKSPSTPTQQINIINTQSKPIPSLPQNSPPQNSPPQNSPPGATGDNSVPIPSMATSTIPQLSQTFPNLLASPKLQRGQMNVGNYIFSPASAASTVQNREIELQSTASSLPNKNPDSTTSSNESAQKTASPELQIQARLNAAQIAYDRAAVKLAELQTTTLGTNPNLEVIAAQKAEQIAAAELGKVQSQARQLLENVKNRP